MGKQNAQAKSNSKSAQTIGSLLLGYTKQERFREMHQKFEMKKRNFDQRQSNDRELMQVQEQVSRSLWKLGNVLSWENDKNNENSIDIYVHTIGHWEKDEYWAQTCKLQLFIDPL